MAGVQGLRGRVNDLIHGNLAHDDLDLDLRQERGVNLGAAVLLAAALLQAAAHDLGHGHAGNANVVQRLLQGLKLGQLHDDGNLVHAGIQLGGQRGVLDDLDRGGDLLGAGLGDVVLAQIGILIRVQLGVGRIIDGEACIGAGQAVLVVIQAVDLLLLGDAQADGLFDDREDDEHRGQHPGRHADNAQQLDAQLGKAAAVEQAALGGKQADGDGAPRTVHAVHRDSADGVIDLGNIVEELNREDAEHTGDDADDGRAERVNDVAARGDGDQTGQRTVEGQGDIGLAVAHPGDDQRRNGSQRGGQVGVEADQTCGNHRVIAGHADGGAAVEAEPAEPQDKNAQSHRGQVVAGDSAGLTGLVVFADAGAEHPGAQAGRDAADEVNCGGAGKIMEAELCQPAAAPDPVAGDGVDDQADGGGVAAVGAELRALGHRAGDDGRGSGAEHSLEHRVDPDRQRAEVIAAADERIKPADERTGTGKHDAEADEPVARRTDTKIHHILHQNIAGIFCTGQASLAQGKARLHEEHQKRSNQCPCNVCGIVHRTEPLSYFSKQKGAGQNHTVRRLCRSFIALMLSQSCGLVKRVGTYFIHICRKCCTTSRKYR